MLDEFDELIILSMKLRNYYRKNKDNLNKQYAMKWLGLIQERIEIIEHRINNEN